jgi:hypothetical protein
MEPPGEQPALMNSPALCGSCTPTRLVVGPFLHVRRAKDYWFPPVAKAMQLDTLGMVGGYIELVCGFHRSAVHALRGFIASA